MAVASPLRPAAVAAAIGMDYNAVAAVAAGAAAGAAVYSCMIGTVCYRHLIPAMLTVVAAAEPLAAAPVAEAAPRALKAPIERKCLWSWFERQTLAESPALTPTAAGV